MSDTTPAPATPKSAPTEPFSIETQTDGITINGRDPDDYIIVGVQNAPNPHKGGDDAEHLCIVSMFEGSIERHDPTAHNLLHELAEMLGYEVKRVR